MPSFGEQIKLASAARLAASALEDLSRNQIVQAFEDWESGVLDAQTVRYRLENVIRSAYRTSAGVAYEASQRNAELPGWEPAVTFNNDYLQELLKDVRRNLREYKKSDQDEKARRRAVLRVQHSAGIASQRGYTDQTIAAYTELEDFGFQLRKIWLANFVDNVPCVTCRKLHGEEVGLHEAFPVEAGEPGVYKDLLGPPRHPQCKCKLVTLIVTLENAFETLNVDKPSDPPQTMTTDQVKKIPNGIFKAVTSVLRAIMSLFRRNRG